ncbi:MAG: R2-like ligand-binding oxidase [Gemmatimonadetes bacterium]|uniref:R2-like ligand binding oxidase n=1 Tax=Candidatus Kutchimonas denitrificans TaxID=3056748 RepID=A0AAE4ZA32_9BACT|nr:R2-like ligand-binding oxidase [Gemmatimonadota bacterium]NIR75838.1 R2-like ligand-binding oxidase [Candidatus Kutchimonas denitrificans]NIS02005.1 R2-like ligand-binding oxidase [Gemmatimonadota bacterium]NIT67809.1 R2-like ligand-binding oxidase [Gemmatimonadota bacterium]NIU53796.1 R2-like ligand-binding oxidase [Gemmatimonadota bacterium]
MPEEIFTGRWVARWAAELNASERYRQAAASWEWPVVFVLDDDSGPTGPRQVFLDLWHGSCRAARPASEADRAAAPYVIAAPEAVWRELLTGDLDPLIALLHRKLEVRQGSVLKLTRYAAAAREMVAAAARIDSAAGASDDGAGSVTSLPPGPGRRAPGFVTTSPEGLDHESLPMRLYHKAKRIGIWNPQDIDFARDIEDWNRLDDLEREVLLHLTSLFQAGEESVAQEIVPLIAAISGERRVEEELYLATFLWEEAKHTEFFRRFLDEVAGDASDLSRFHGASYRVVFYEQLPVAMGALLEDPTPEAQVRASVTYNMIVEGTLAETGYHAYYAMLERNDLLPGLREGVGLLKRDESRHIAYGVFLLSRLLATDPGLWPGLERHMQSLLEPALGIIHELFDAYEVVPFGLEIDDFLDYALAQFQKRLARLERARELTPDQVMADLSGDPELEQPGQLSG